MTYTEFLSRFSLTEEVCPFSAYVDIECFYTNCDSFNSQKEFFEYAESMDFSALLRTAEIFKAEIGMHMREKNASKDMLGEERQKSEELKSKLLRAQEFIETYRTAIEDSIKDFTIRTAAAYAKKKVDEILGI